MKQTIKYFVASLALIVSLAAVTALPAGAIDVFSGSCGSGSTGTTGTTNNSGGTGTNGDGNKGLGNTNNNTGTNGTGNSGSSSLCGAAASDEAPDIVRNIINTMLFVLGMIAVIMIVVGGMRYTISNGDASQIKAAKDTILYAVIGLVVAIMAFAIVNFVVTQIGK